MATRALQNQDLNYNATAIESHLNSVVLEASVEELTSMDFDSTGEEVQAGVQNWTCNATGYWDSTVDGVVAPDALSAPTTLRTLISTTGEATNDTAWTWTTNAFIASYVITAGRGLINIDVEFGLSGEPARA